MTRRLTSIPCIRCGDEVEVPHTGRRPKHCKPCAVMVNREKARDRQRALDGERRFARGIAENLRQYVTAEMWVKVEEYIEALGLSPDDEWPVTPDKMPDGTMSDTGPDEGTSTGWTDLADELERRRMRAIMDDWFVANPRWLDGVND